MTRQEKFNLLYDFLDFTNDKDIILARWDSDSELNPIRVSWESIIQDFLRNEENPDDEQLRTQR